MAEGRSDRDLVARALEGDQQAFGVLVARYRSAVVGVAFHRTGSFEDARDIAQETFIKAFGNLPKLRKPESFASWLYHIADLTALSIARRPRREVPLPSVEALVSPAPQAEVSELTEQVREALAALDEPTRLAVVLHYIDGYSHAEVANFLGTTAGAVRTRVSRAKSRLREEIMSETERALKEAVERVLAAVSGGDWQAALDEVRRSGLPPEQYPELAWGAGVAGSALARQDPFDTPLLREGARLLLRVWEGGRRDEVTVVELAEALIALGEYGRVPPILAPFVEETPDPNLRVRVAGRVVVAWWMLGDYAAVVKAHRAALAGAGERADLEVKLDSYAQVGLAYAQQGAGLEWLEEVQHLWHAAPEAVWTPMRAWMLLASTVRTAVNSQEVESTRARALQFCQDLLQDPRFEDAPDRPAALGARGRMWVEMFRLYSLVGSPDKAESALRTAKAVAQDLLRGGEEPGADRDVWREAASGILHNAGFVCRSLGRKQEALALLREVVTIWPFPPTFLGLAALIIETSGDRQEALRCLRRVAEDTRWVASGFPQQEFLRDPAFEAVRDDPEFLAVVNGWREAGAQAQE
jgi:RNA polymerase sigma-70 factor (ECF subfamily)